MNPTDAAVAERATAPSASMAKVSPPSAQVRSGHIEIRHRGFAPSVHPDAYVAPTAVLSGQVSIGPGSCVLHGAVLAAEGGPVQVGAGCVIMENAVLRGTVPHPLLMGDRVLAGPHAQLTGATLTDEVFIAAGAMVCNGAHLGRAASVAPGAIVHLGAIVAAARPDPGRVGGGRRPRPRLPTRPGRGDQGRAGRDRLELPAVDLRHRRRRRPPRPATDRPCPLHRGDGPPPPPRPDHHRPLSRWMHRHRQPKRPAVPATASGSRCPPIGKQLTASCGRSVAGPAEP